MTRPPQPVTAAVRSSSRTLVQRVAAYALVRDGERVLLVRAAAASAVPGTWFLPGGGVEHGEHPEDALVRETEEETGYVCAPLALLRVHSSLSELPGQAALLHTVGLVYHAEIRSGALRNEQRGSSDMAAWLEVADALRLPLAPYVDDVIGLPDPGYNVSTASRAAPVPTSLTGTPSAAETNST